jgi:hypothetical protein
MEIINILPSEQTPKVMLNSAKRFFEIEGESRPENAHEFFYPIVTELKNYMKSVDNEFHKDIFSEFPFAAHFKLMYFNSSSAKFISDLLFLFKKYSDKGLKLRVYWYYNDGDEDQRDVGEDLSEMVGFQFTFVMVKDS